MVFYGLYFSYDKTTVRIPVNPEQYTISNPTEHSRYNVLDLGEIVIPELPGLLSISWEGFLPGDSSHPYVVTSGGFKPPKYYIDLFVGYMKSRAPVRFIANRYYEDGRTIFDTNIQVIIENFEYSEKGGETGDFYYSIELTEYRSFAPKTVTIQLQKKAAVAEPKREIPPKQAYVGCTVIVNGDYWYDSYGSNPHGTFNNFQGKISKIVSKPARKYPYHITTMSGGWRGWVGKDQVKVI